MQKIIKPKYIVLLICIICLVFAVIVGVFSMPISANTAFDDKLITNLKDSDFVLSSGIKLRTPLTIQCLSDDSQALFPINIQEKGFNKYYNWYSNPQKIKEDFFEFCGLLNKKYLEESGKEFKNIYLSIDLKMVYSYLDDKLYLSNMYKEELKTLKKFKVQDVLQLCFREDARKYLVDKGFSSGIDGWVNAPTTDLYFSSCPSVSIYNGMMTTDLEGRLVF